MLWRRSGSASVSAAVVEALLDRPGYFELFAGGGMVRAGLGPRWRCLLANDIDPVKAAAYRRNWGDAEFVEADLRGLVSPPPAGRPALVWGSFPCQDLSLAGAGAGFGGARSALYHVFWDLLDAMAAEGRAPALVAVENVAGALTSRGGADFAAMLARFRAAGYRAGALLIDAALFVPQSRPRLFVIGAKAGVEALATPGPAAPFHASGLRRAVSALPEALRRDHVWWRVAAPPARNADLAALLEPDAPCRPEAETARLLALMSEANRAKLDAAQATGRPMAGCVFRRTRRDRAGERRQRAEVRFDGLAGCLRTPAGGSSRQTVLLVEGARVRSRLLTPRETARLMGLPEDYVLPARANDAYRLTGDGVAVDVVRWLRDGLLAPLLENARVDAAA